MTVIVFYCHFYKYCAQSQPHNCVSKASMIVISQHNLPGIGWEWWCWLWSFCDVLLQARFSGTISHIHRCFGKSFVLQFCLTVLSNVLLYSAVWLEGPQKLYLGFGSYQSTILKNKSTDRHPELEGSYDKPHVHLSCIRSLVLAGDLI